MACLSNIRIKQVVTYDNTPDLENGMLSGSVLLEIYNTDGYPISGEITVDKVRDLPVVNLDDAPISETQSITSTGDTYDFNFYYPYTEPSNIVIGVSVKIRVEDCFYEQKFNHILLTPNPDFDFSYVDEFVQGYAVISGCTDSAYYEYNPEANFDDGSCLNLKPVFGCTNPLALNYDPTATFNDGTCVFKSGCTNPLAINYNSSALIDDGTCECGDINIKLDLGYSSGESIIIEPDCQYTIEFDLIAKINCEKLINYLEKDTRTILEVLEDLSINAQTFVLTDEEGLILEYTGGTIGYTGSTDNLLVQTEELYSFDRTIVPYGIGLEGSEEDCDFINQLISAELDLDCPAEQEISNRFNIGWKKYTYVLNSDLVQTFTSFVLNFKNFNFGLCTYIDNVKLSKICERDIEKCLIIPSKYGFEIDKVIDNKKSWVYSQEVADRFYDFKNQETDYISFDSRLIFNTKELELTVNPVKYIEKDVFEYFDYYSKFYKDTNYTGLTRDKVIYESSNVNGIKFIRKYPIDTIYEQYLDGLDCAVSKGLTYSYGLDIISKLNNTWYKTVKDLIPATTIWNEAEYTLKNSIFHKPKFVYKKYTLGGPSDTDIDPPSGVTLSCSVMSDKCSSEPYSSIDDLLTFDFGNIECTSIYSGGTFGYSGGSGDGYFSGKLVQFSVNDNGQNIIEDKIGFNDYICITGEPIPTGGTCDSVTINPNLSYVCGLSGRVYNGTAVVTITPTGGVAPYTITGSHSGVVNNEGESLVFVALDQDIIAISVTDANGCTSNIIDGTTTINCPEFNNCTPVTCGSNQFQFEVVLINDTSGLGVYTLGINLTSPSSYTGTITGSYKVSNLAITSSLVGFERYHAGADYTPNVELNNYIEFGFNELTPGGDYTTAGATNSPWMLYFVNSTPFTTDNPNFIPGGTTTIEVVLFDEDYCVHKASVTLTIPADGFTSTDTSSIF